MKQFALMAVAVAGCAEQQTPPPVRTSPPTMGSRPVGPGGAPQIDSCGLGSIGDLVGKPVTETTADDARKRSGARAVRVIRPGMMVTMDFRPDRLNIVVDDKGNVTNLRCG
jgi:hypothetical protein